MHICNFSGKLKKTFLFLFQLSIWSNLSHYNLYVTWRKKSKILLFHNVDCLSIFYFLSIFSSFVRSYLFLLSISFRECLFVSSFLTHHRSCTKRQLPRNTVFSNILTLNQESSYLYYVSVVNIMHSSMYKSSAIFHEIKSWYIMN